MSGIPLLFGPYGRLTEATARQVAGAGGNAVWFHGFDPEMFALSEACGLAACVEVKTFRASFSDHPELQPIGVDGNPIRHGRLVQGICLSHADYLAEIEEGLGNGLRDYSPAGIWLDYLTYGGWFETPEPDLQESCFCPACIGEFCEAEGVDAESAEVILEKYGPLWTQHKCRRIAGYALRYSRMIRAGRPGCTVGAYMCPYTPQELDGALSRIFAQDYELLAPALDVFTPLVYVAKSGRTAAWGREILQASPGFVPQDRRIQLILDTLDFPAGLEETSRSPVPSWGIQMFGGSSLFEEPGKRQVFRRAVERIREACGSPGS